MSVRQTCSYRSFARLALAAAIALCGCRQQTARPAADVNELVETLLPQKIVTQRSFTRPIDTDDDGAADAIDAVVIAQDAYGDPTKCLGTWHFELYTLRLASGDRLGERLAHWPVDMTEPDDAQVFWDRVSRFYRFTLELEASLPPGQYVLTVTLRTPTERNLFDEYRFDHEQSAYASRP